MYHPKSFPVWKVKMVKSRELGPDWVGNDTFLDDLPQVQAESLAELGGSLTLGELKGALQEMECGKAPGLDGIPVSLSGLKWERTF